MFLAASLLALETIMITRRRFTNSLGATIISSGFAGVASVAPGAASPLATVPEALARLESESGGRLGVAVIDTGTNTHAGWRSEERFPMCSTFKFLAAAAILARVDAGQERIDRRIHFKASDLVTYSPISKDHVDGRGMTVEELCEAAVVVSDNTAANLLLADLNGPAGLTAFARSIGDGVTRLDRAEPALNEAAVGDPRDTASPAAMASNLRMLLLENRLSAPSRARLTGWLRASKTGGKRLRAGLPKGWGAGDKTGSGGRGTTNDIGILWPPGRPPAIVAAYLTDTAAPSERRDETLAAVGRVIASTLDR